MDLSPEQGVRLQRAAVRYLKSKREKKPSHAKRAPGMWWLSCSPAVWVKSLETVKAALVRPAEQPFCIQGRKA